MIRERLVKEGCVRAPAVTIKRLVSRGFTSAEKTLVELGGWSRLNLSRTLRTMFRYGLADLKKGEHGTLVPRVRYDQMRLDISLTPSPMEVA